MQQRDRQGRYRQVRVTTRWEYIVCLSILGGIFTGLYMDKKDLNPWAGPIIYTAEAASEPLQDKPKEVRIKVVYSKEGIERLIRETFHEAPNTAVAIAKCESGLNKDIQSHFILSYGREQSFGIFQIHAKDWDAKAKKLGYGDYKTDVEDNIKMARYLYESRGNFKDWSCYNNGSYKAFL